MHIKRKNIIKTIRFIGRYEICPNLNQYLFILFFTQKTQCCCFSHIIRAALWLSLFCWERHNFNTFLFSDDGWIFKAVTGDINRIFHLRNRTKSQRESQKKIQCFWYITFWTYLSSSNFLCGKFNFFRKTRWTRHFLNHKTSFWLKE